MNRFQLLLCGRCRGGFLFVQCRRYVSFEARQRPVEHQCNRTGIDAVRVLFCIDALQGGMIGADIEPAQWTNGRLPFV